MGICTSKYHCVIHSLNPLNPLNPHHYYLSKNLQSALTTFYGFVEGSIEENTREICIFVLSINSKVYVTFILGKNEYYLLKDNETYIPAQLCIKNLCVPWTLLEKYYFNQNKMIYMSFQKPQRSILEADSQNY